MQSNIHHKKPGRSRQFTTFNQETKQKVVTLEPGQTVTVAESDRPGQISRIWLTLPGWFWPHWEPNRPVDPSILKKVIMRIYWDGMDRPSVEAPVGDFFGIGHSEYRHYLSKYLGMSSGGFYSYFPMPYEKIRIEFQNLHETNATDIFFNANYQELDELPEGSGRFHCLFRTARLEGRDSLMIMEAEGKGHFVGCSLSMQAEQKNYLAYLEAPEHIYLDFEEGSEAAIVGTGLEDYFNGGWYFRDGEFAGELHGVPLKDALRSMITMYRFHEEDAISFERNIRVAFENHWKGGHLLPFWYSSTAYWYQEEASGLRFDLPSAEQLMSQYRIRDVDHQSIP